MALGRVAVAMNRGAANVGVVAVLLVFTACGTATGATWVTICCMVVVSTSPRSVMYAVSPGATSMVTSVPWVVMFGLPTCDSGVAVTAAFARVMFCCCGMSWHW